MQLSLVERQTPCRSNDRYITVNLYGRDVDNLPIAEAHGGLVQKSSDGHLQHHRLP